MRPKLRYYEALLFAESTTSHGTGFQDLIARYLEIAYPGDFRRIRAHGPLGDGGNDGLRPSTGTIYQMYGKERDAKLNVTTLVKKINDDFETARNKHLGTMREWVFVHNLVAGLPDDASTAIETLKKRHPDYAIHDLSKAGLESILFKLPDEDLERLFGENKGRTYTDIDPTDLQRLLKGLAAANARPLQFLDKIRPVPFEKIEYNLLSEPYARLIRDNFVYHAQVEDFVSKDPDLQFGDRVSERLAGQYRSLRGQKIPPDEVIEALRDFILAVDRNYSVSEIQAADAILAYFFEKCDIFEDVPQRLA